MIATLESTAVVEMISQLQQGCSHLDSTLALRTDISPGQQYPISKCKEIIKVRLLEEMALEI